MISNTPLNNGTAPGKWDIVLNYRRRNVRRTDLPNRLASIDNTMRQNRRLFQGTSRGAMAR